MWHNVWAVIRREYLQRVRSRWFVIATIGGPLIMLAMMLLPIWLAVNDEQADRNIVVVDATGVLYDRIEEGLDDAGFTVRQEPWTTSVIDELRQQATDGEIGGFVLLDDMTLEAGEAVMYANDRPSAFRRLSMRTTIARAALEVQLEAQDVDAGALMAGGDLQIELLTTEGASEDEPEFIVAYIGAFLLYMIILLYAVSVMRATLEEKTNRVVEVIVSAMKPWHLMLGKIIGVGAVGLTQMGVWILSGILMSSAGIPALIAARPELVGLENIREILPSLGLLTLFFGFFLFGFFMFSGLYAAVGAMCSTDEEAQQAQFPVMMFLIIPIIFVMPVIQDPMTPMATGLSLFPLFSPVLMWARVAGGGVPAWQVATSFVLMTLAVFAIAWIAGRIYKVGILMAGKRPTLPELWRWVREA